MAIYYGEWNLLFLFNISHLHHYLQLQHINIKYNKINTHRDIELIDNNATD
jgi:hypothetical protein